MAFGKFGRYHPDGVDVHPVGFDLVALVEEEVARAVEPARLELTTAGPTLEIESDPLQVRYLVVNLLQNALKYSDDRVRVRVGGDDDSATVEVADAGIGIPENELAELFSPFFRASNVAGRPGTGMGLAIVKKSAHLIGARVEVETGLGAGTTFTISLPRRPPSG
jgi:signal transduction histidine kinase